MTLHSRLQKLEKLEKAVTPGEWTRHSSGIYLYVDLGDSIHKKVPSTTMDNTFIATVRNELPWLLSSLRKAVSALEHITGNYAPGSCCDDAFQNSDMDGHFLDIARKVLKDLNNNEGEA